jgi:hypothetical protein
VALISGPETGCLRTDLGSIISHAGKRTYPHLRQDVSLEIVDQCLGEWHGSGAVGPIHERAMLPRAEPASGDPARTGQVLRHHEH